MQSGSRPNPMLISVIGGVLVLLVIGFNRINSQRPEVVGTESPFVRLADSAVHNFHQAVSTRTYGAACEMADSGAFRGISGLDCAQFLNYVRRRLGTVRSTQRTSAVQQAFEGSPVRVSVSYQTSFERDSATENFEWLIADNKPILTSYNVSAAVLSK